MLAKKNNGGRTKQKAKGVGLLAILLWMLLHSFDVSYGDIKYGPDSKTWPKRISQVLTATVRSATGALLRLTYSGYLAAVVDRT